MLAARGGAVLAAVGC